MMAPSVKAAIKSGEMRPASDKVVEMEKKLEQPLQAEDRTVSPSPAKERKVAPGQAEGDRAGVKASLPVLGPPVAVARSDITSTALIVHLEPAVAASHTPYIGGYLENLDRLPHGSPYAFILVPVRFAVVSHLRVDARACQAEPILCVALTARC